jgi:hypothetical protein
LHAPRHARGRLTGPHAQACMPTHAHHGTCPRSRAQSWAPPSMTLRCTHLRRDRAGTAPGPRRCWCTSAPGLMPICACD